jgi:hypothetical protein
VDDVRQAHRGGRDGQRARLDLDHEQEVADEPEQTVAVPVDDLRKPRPGSERRCPSSSVRSSR